MKKVAIGICLVAFALGILTSCGDATVKSKPAATATTVNPEKAAVVSNSAFYDFKMNDIDGNEIDFSKFKGEKVLIVNVASKCGYTPQYEGLEALNKQHGDKVIILGFPANNFGGQEPGSNAEIKKFCTGNYGVSFTMMEKVSVKGADQNALYTWLSDKDKNGWNDQAPNWNFNKYLINEKGELVKYFGSKVKPMSPELVNAILD
ncbi:glutathione peroxidase [Persicobacter psychrovividus]|uniref:Glutathione peroxidase n=1 Tax=Persicobacter psychrovividus TaxID=387638 RepID=A0ABM7VCD8_9BACT|nr:glutathione peroxidase [Persicobacter psychrovividus]